MNLSNFQQSRIPPSLDSWNPQEDDFKSRDFNCYDRGPGKYLPKSSQKHVQLYVQGIPNEMTEDGLRNLFMKAGTVRKVMKMTSKKPGALDTYGFITMSNVREADEAIRRFNLFRINQFMLKVRISVSPEERQRHQQKKQEEEEFIQSLKTSQVWAPVNGTQWGADSNRENGGSYQQSNGYGFSSAESPHSSPKYGLGRGGFPKGYQDSAKVGPSGDGQKLHDAGSMSSLHNPRVLRDSFQGQENPQFNNQWSPNRNYCVEGLKITIGKSVSLNESRHVLPTEETMTLRHHSSNQHYTGFDPGLMQQGRVLGQDRFAPTFGRGRKPAMGCGYNHYSHNPNHVGRGRGFQKQNYYSMPAPEAFCDQGLYGPSPQSYAVQPGLVKVPSYMNTGLYKQSPYLLQAVPTTPQIQMQSTAAANMEDTRSVAEKSAKTVKLEPRECTNCQKIGTFQCKRCKIPYCCTDCQKQDWPRHKNFCSKIKEVQDTDEFKDFDVTFGEDLVDNVKTLIEKHTGDAVVVDKSSWEKACNVQQQQNRKSGKLTGKTSTGDQSGKVKERDAPRSKVADNNRKDLSKGSDKEHGAMNNQSGLKNQNRSPQKNKMTKTQSDDYNRGKERNDQFGNQNRRGGADRRNDVQKYQSRNKQDGRTDANEQEWEDVSNKEQFRNRKTDVAATMQTVPRPLSRKQPGSYPHPVADNLQQSSGPVFVSELPSVLSEVKVGEELEVIITAHESPANFTVQIIQLERIQMFSTFSDKLNELYDEEKEPYRPGKVGELVVARYSFDQKWYRAEVRKLSPSTVSLSFIDFGNEEDASYSQIRKAKPLCREVASQSLKCCLIGMESQTTITKDDIEEFGRRLKQIADPSQGRILLTIKAIAKGYVLIDTIDVESNRSLAAVMSERFSSRKTRTHVSSADRSSSPVMDIKVFELQCDGSSSLGLIVYITGLDSFHIQPQDEASKSHLQSLMLQIQQYCSSMPTPYIPVIGEIVCAMFSDDKRWYRAQVKKKVEKDIYSVCCVDYGNCTSVNVSYIRVLEKKFAELPCMGIPCRLAGLRDKDNKDILQEFVTMVINTVVRVKAVRFRDGLYEVEISLTDGTSVSEKIGCVMSTANKGEVRKTEARAAAVSERIMAADVPSQQLPDNCQVSVDLIELESLSCFYLKRMDIYDADEFQELETEIGKYCVSNMAAHTPVVGELVAAKFTNNKWYRANVVQVKPSTCDVIFTDYGNQDTVENCNVRKLREEFTKLPFVAIKCKLSGIQTATDEAKLLSFAKDVIGQNIKGQAVAIDKNGVTEVKLFSVDGSCINDRVALTDQKEICGSLSEVQEPLIKESKTEIVIMAKDVRPVELPTDGSKVEVEVVEIFGLEYFFVKTVDDASRVKLDSQQIEINILCKEDSTEYTPVIDELVAALFEGVWYRGKVVEGDRNIFNILYVDFGNVNAVTRNQIRKLNTRFADLPFMAIPCRLQGLSQPVTQEMLLDFAGDVVEKRVLLESHGFINGVMEVVLFTDDGICINKKLGLQVSSIIVPTSLTTTTLHTVPTSDTTSYVHQEEKMSAVMASDVQPYTLTVDGAGVEVEVLVVHNLNSFYVQVTEENQQRKLKNLMAEMAGFCSSSAISYKPQVGEMVVAQYYEDKMWYRARVDGVQNDVFDVFYVDYGNMEQMQASSLRKFEPMFGTLPQMAVHCKLSYTGTEDDSDLRIAKFAQEVLMKRVLMMVTGYVDGKYEVVIYLSDGTTIQSILSLEKEEKVLLATQMPACSRGVARHMADQMMKVDLPEDGSFIDAVVFEMKRLDSFYIQKRSEEVQVLLEQIEEYCNKQTPRYAPVIGELVCAKFSQDNLWYRARVDELIEEGVYRVLFVDYGNSDIVSEEMMIKCDDIIFSVPQQGIRCKLSEVGAVQMDEKLQAFVSSLVNVLVKIRVVKCISGVYEVELYTGDGSVCLNYELKSLSNSLTEEAKENIDAIIAPAIFTTASASSADQDIKLEISMERLVVLAKDFPHAEPFGSEFGIVITSVVDPRCFYCQLADEEVVSVFGEMMDRLSEHCQSEPALPDVVYTEGELCCAKFPADGKWYRACILKLNPNGTALVFYVDFGNEEVVSLDDLNSLSKEFQTLPILALRCCLSGLQPIDGAWKPEAINVLKSLQEQVLRVKLVEVFDNRYHLIVLHMREGGETVSLNQILIEAGLAQPTPVRQPSPALAESTEIDAGEQGLVNAGVEKSLKFHSSSQVPQMKT